MATRNITWGTPTALTITLDSLASSATAGRKSAAITIGGKPYLGLMVTLKVATGTIANAAGAYVWWCQSLDNTTYEEALTAGDAAYTPHSPSCMQYLGFIPIPVQNTTNTKFFEILDPTPYGVLVVRNYCGITLDSSGNSVYYITGEDTIA